MNVSPPNHSEDPTLLFLHIPKAAGTTLHRILEREYAGTPIFTLDHRLPPTQFTDLPEEERAGYRLVKGHMGFGFHKTIPRPAYYMTLLREPFSRLSSMYHFARLLPTHYLHRAILEENLSLEQFLASGLGPELENNMTLLLAGSPPEESRDCTEEHFRRAVTHLEEHFVVAGLAERFDETLLLLERRLGWRRRPYYVRENVTAQRAGAVKQMSAEREPEESTRRAWNVCRERNSYDFRLYAWVVDRFERAVCKELPTLSGDLRRFKIRNAAYARSQALLGSLRGLVDKF